MSNYSTYYVEPIKIKYVSDICIDHNLAEKEIFTKLRQYRITEKREFFNINLEYAIEIIKTTINDINKKITNTAIMNNIINNTPIINNDINNNTSIINNDIYNNTSIINNDINNTITNIINSVSNIASNNYNFTDDTKLNKLLNIALNRSPYDVAIVLYYMYQDKLCYVNDVWHYFDGNLWRYFDKLRFFIFSVLVKLYEPYCKIVMVNELVDSLKTSSYRDLIIIQAIPFFKTISSNYDDIFNNNNFLIGFNNGIYDLNICSFRQANSKDYVSFSVNYDYNESNPLRRHELNNYLKSILPNEQHLTMLLNRISISLSNNYNILTFFEGIESTGKTTFSNFLLDTLHIYALTACTSIFNDYNSSYNKSKIIVINHIKHREIKPNLNNKNMFIVCNIKPKITIQENMPEILIIPFLCQFVDNPTKNQYKKINNLDLKHLRLEFMLLLIENYKRLYNK